MGEEVCGTMVRIEGGTRKGMGRERQFAGVGEVGGKGRVQIGKCRSERGG